MATELLARGTTDANSATVTLADGETALIFLTTDAGGAIPPDVKVDVQFLSTGGTWGVVAQMAAPDRVALSVPGPCSFRVHRRFIPAAWGVAIGVDRG